MKKVILFILGLFIYVGSFAQTVDTTLTATLVSKAPYATSITYQWVKTSGPTSGVISNPDSLNTRITGLVVGTYIFTITATDNFGNVSIPQITEVDVYNPVSPVISTTPLIKIITH